MCDIPIGKPWEKQVADTWKVSASHKNDHYLLVVMDYFTKWVEAAPHKDQTTALITQAIIKIQYVVHLASY